MCFVAPGKAPSAYCLRLPAKDHVCVATASTTAPEASNATHKPRAVPQLKRPAAANAIATPITTLRRVSPTTRCEIGRTAPCILSRGRTPRATVASKLSTDPWFERRGPPTSIVCRAEVTAPGQRQAGAPHRDEADVLPANHTQANPQPARSTRAKSAPVHARNVRFQAVSSGDAAYSTLSRHPAESRSIMRKAAQESQGMAGRPRRETLAGPVFETVKNPL